MEKRWEPAHWRRIMRPFEFERCNERNAATAARWLDVADPLMLRITYDLNLGPASRNALDKRMLLANDAWIAAVKAELAEAEAIRKEIAIAEFHSAREMTAVATLVLPSQTGGEPVTYHFQEHELIIKECLEEAESYG